MFIDLAASVFFRRDFLLILEGSKSEGFLLFLVNGLNHTVWRILQLPWLHYRCGIEKTQTYIQSHLKAAERHSLKMEPSGEEVSEMVIIKLISVP